MSFINTMEFAYKHCLKKLKKLQEEYFVIENKEIKFEGEEGNKKPVMIEGKTQEDYNNKYAELMNTEVNVVL